MYTSTHLCQKNTGRSRYPNPTAYIYIIVSDLYKTMSKIKNLYPLILDTRIHINTWFAYPYAYNN